MEKNSKRYYISVCDRNVEYGFVRFKRLGQGAVLNPPTMWADGDNTVKTFDSFRKAEQAAKRLQSMYRNYTVRIETKE